MGLLSKVRIVNGSVFGYFSTEERREQANRGGSKAILSR